MLAGDKTILKQVLRAECLPALSDHSKYYSTEVIKAWLHKRNLRCPSATLNRYLHELTRTKVIFSAGRGWYSSLPKAFALDRKPVSNLVQGLELFLNYQPVGHITCAQRK
jgi:arginine repressor